MWGKGKVFVYIESGLLNMLFPKKNMSSIYIWHSEDEGKSCWSEELLKQKAGKVVRNL